MREEPPHSTQALIDRVRGGDQEAIDQLFSAAYDELRDLAQKVRRRGAGETIQTTVLVHEAYFKFAGSERLGLESRAHFKHLVGRAMRQVLVDAARVRNAKKRGGKEAINVTLHDWSASVSDEVDVLELHEALERLGEADPRAAEVVACRFFGDLDVEETAAALGVSTATVKRDWRVARAWLGQALS